MSDHISLIDFAKTVTLHTVRGPEPMILSAYVMDAFTAFTSHRYTIINKSRQCGGTTILSVYAAWFAMNNPGANIVIASPSIIRENLLNHIRPLLTTEPLHNTKNQIELQNGAVIRVVGMNSHSTRGLRIDLLLIDEMASARGVSDYEFWNAAITHMATGSEIIIASTPSSYRGLFYDLWTDRTKKGFNGLIIPWHIVPIGMNGFIPIFRDDAWAQQVIAQIGHQQFMMEFECQWPRF